MHNLCVFCTFSTFAQKIFKGWGCNFTWSFVKVMRIKSLKMAFVARIIRHKLWLIYAFFDFFLLKNYFLTADINFDYPGSIVYLSCFYWFFVWPSWCPHHCAQNHHSFLQGCFSFKFLAIRLDFCCLKFL